MLSKNYGYFHVFETCHNLPELILHIFCSFFFASLLHSTVKLIYIIVFNEPMISASNARLLMNDKTLSLHIDFNN